MQKGIPDGREIPALNMTGDGSLSISQPGHCGIAGVMDRYRDLIAAFYPFLRFRSNG
jgi:hypothetical protein